MTHRVNENKKKMTNLAEYHELKALGVLKNKVKVVDESVRDDW